MYLYGSNGHVIAHNGDEVEQYKAKGYGEDRALVGSGVLAGGEIGEKTGGNTDEVAGLHDLIEQLQKEHDQELQNLHDLIEQKVIELQQANDRIKELEDGQTSGSTDNGQANTGAAGANTGKAGSTTKATNK